MGTAILDFMRAKKNPFPNALLSKKHFNRIPVWRVANVVVSLLKYVLEINANQHWYNYGYQAWKFTTTVFEAYCTKHDTVWIHCRYYQKLPDDYISMIPNMRTPVKKRSRSNFELDTPEDERSAKTVCVITDSSSDEESGD